MLIEYVWLMCKVQYVDLRSAPHINVFNAATSRLMQTSDKNGKYIIKFTLNIAEDSHLL